MQEATWLDDYFGKHRYGVRFPDGKIFPESEIEAIEVNGVGAECNANQTSITHWDKSNERTSKRT